jgi:hypothetical protein
MSRRQAAYVKDSKQGVGVLQKEGGLYFVETELPAIVVLTNDREITPSMVGRAVEFSIDPTEMDKAGRLKGIPGKVMGKAEAPEHRQLQIQTPAVPDQPFDDGGGAPATPGVTASRTLNIQVPKDIPHLLRPIFIGAVRSVHASKKLLDRNGNVQFPAIRKRYAELLANYHQMAVEAENA